MGGKPVPTEPAAVLSGAEAAFDRVIAAVRGTAWQDDPAILNRIGRIDTALAAARALVERGQGEAATLLAADALREIARDFPAQASGPLDLRREDHLRRELARRILEQPA
jgi:hypothetical protein